MDCVRRINHTFLEILEADEQITRQEEHVAYLDEQGMLGAATCARETLMVMADRLLALCDRHSVMITLLG